MFCTYLVDDMGTVVHRNFMPVRVTKGASPRRETIGEGTVALRKAPGEFASAGWSVKSSSVLDGRKVWGTGTGYFEYEFPWPSGVKPEDGASVEFVAELASRRVQGKDMDDTFERMTIESVGTRGIDPGHNPNSYPMTDGKQDPSTVRITLNGMSPRDVHLADDPSDHRGILSWLSQKEDGYLHEAGSYGYPIRVAFDADAVARAASEGVIRIRLEVAEAGDGFGGLSVYGESFGRFPMDPAALVKPAQ